VNPFDQNGQFRTAISPATGDVRRLAVRGAGATVLSGGLGLAIQIASTTVLARLLTPRDFGVVAMVTTFSLLLMNFGLNGFTEAIVQRESIDRALASNLFWINTGCSLLLSLGFAASGKLLAMLYHDDQVIFVTRAVATTIFLTGLAVLPLALLKRAMRFPSVSANDLAARTLAVVTSIVLGWAGWGYWALVAGVVASAASTCIGAWILCFWIPDLPSRNAGTRPTVAFAMHTYGRFTTGYFSNNLDNFLVGWRLGSAPLGFYKKAYDLFVLPSSQLSLALTTVAIAALSRFQKDVGQYRRYLLSALGLMAFIGMALSADLTLVGKDLIYILLGPKWNESGRIFTLFAPGIGAMLLYCTHIWIHLSIGRADRWFRWGLVDMLVTALLLVIGLHWRAEGIAAAWVVSYWIITLPALWYAGHPMGIGIAAIIGVIWRYVVASVFAGFTTFAIRGWIPQVLAMAPTSLAAFERLVIQSLICLALYVGAVIVLHRGCKPLYQIIGLLREVRGKSAQPPTPVEPATVVSACVAQA
jgi:PST family polysaccharide transporter